jgi:hypothetical protein
MGWTLGLLEALDDGESAGVGLRRLEGPHLLSSGRSCNSRSSRPEARVVLEQHARRPAGWTSPGRGEGRLPTPRRSAGKTRGAHRPGRRSVSGPYDGHGAPHLPAPCHRSETSQSQVVLRIPPQLMDLRGPLWTPQSLLSRSPVFRRDPVRASGKLVVASVVRHARASPVRVDRGC